MVVASIEMHRPGQEHTLIRKHRMLAGQMDVPLARSRRACGTQIPFVTDLRKRVRLKREGRGQRARGEEGRGLGGGEGREGVRVRTERRERESATDD